MASKRAIRRKMCNKIQYKTKKEATTAMHIAKKQLILFGHLNTYKCPFCKQFHWGHS